MAGLPNSKSAAALHQADVHSVQGVTIDPDKNSINISDCIDWYMTKIATSPGPRDQTDSTGS